MSGRGSALSYSEEGGANLRSHPEDGPRVYRAETLTIFGALFKNAKLGMKSEYLFIMRTEIMIYYFY